MTQRENAINNQVVDLTEINRQLTEYVIDLELELAELTNKWKYVSEELEEMKYQKILEIQCDTPTKN